MMQPEAFDYHDQSMLSLQNVISWSCDYQPEPFCDMLEVENVIFDPCNLFDSSFLTDPHPMLVTDELVQTASPCDSEEDPQFLLSLVEDFLLNDVEVSPPALADTSEELGSEGCLSSLEGSSSSSSTHEVIPSPLIMSAVHTTMEVAGIQQEDTIEDREVQVRLRHLLVAYGEATENGHRELEEVIMASLKERGNPYGKILERILFTLCQKQFCYLRHECRKNLRSAFRAFYRVFPYGRVAHFAANSTILESLSDDVDTIWIVDFDMGEGVQWPPFIETLAERNKGVTVRITAIKWGVEDFKDDCWIPLIWSFEEAKWRLVDHARSSSVKLIVEEIKMEELVREMKRTKKRLSGKKEIMVFNCMANLPHMGRVRSRKLVDKFLCDAKDIVGHNKGVLILGDGDVCGKLKGCYGYGSFCKGLVGHYHALLESMESSFPVELVEARTAMECLFIAPYVSSHVWVEKWMEMNEGCYSFEIGNGLEGVRVSNECFEEAKEMVKEEQHSNYGVRIGEGQQQNQMVLEWKGIPMVTISSWRL